MIKLKEQKVRQKIAMTGLSVRAWGEQHGFSQGTLSNWLIGARNIKHSSLFKLAEALNCEPEEIASVVFVYTGEGINELEADREEISGIFGNLSKKQRKAIIVLAETVADANRRAEEAEVREEFSR